jgi:hypothetical protein
MKIPIGGVTTLEKHKIKQALLTKEIVICEDRHTHVEVLLEAIDMLRSGMQFKAQIKQGY